MILTLTLVCQLCVGASSALACRFAGEGKPFWRGPALLALACYEATVVIPPCAYALWRFPEAVPPSAFGAPTYALLALGVALLGYVLAHAAVARRKLTLGWGVAGLGLMLLPLAAWLGGRQDITGITLRDNAHIVALWRAVWPLQGIGWIFCLWRLNLYDRVQRKAAGQDEGPSSLQLISAEILSVVRPQGTRKHEGGGPSA